MNTTEAKHYVRYKGEVMTVAEFARRIGVNYDTLRNRIKRGANLTDPIVPKNGVRAGTKMHGYSFEELGELYSRFRGAEDELRILADFACVDMNKAASILEKLRRQADEKYWEVKK